MLLVNPQVGHAIPVNLLNQHNRTGMSKAAPTHTVVPPRVSHDKTSKQAHVGHGGRLETLKISIFMATN